MCPCSRACSTARSEPQTKNCRCRSIQKCGGKSAMSVSTVTNGRPGHAFAKLSHKARLKCGTKDTTMSGAVSRQCRSSTRTVAACRDQIANCNTFIKYTLPKVQPLRSIQL